MFDQNKFKNKLKEVEEWLKRELSNIRTGRANSAVLDSVMVESYGAFMPIAQVAAVVSEGPTSLRVNPWDNTLLKAIEKGIQNANLGLGISVDDKGVRVSFPELTGERRQEFVKKAKATMENAKINVRKERDQAMKDLQVLEKAGGVGEDEIRRNEKEVQKAVDEMNKSLEALFGKKEKELLS